MTVELYTLRAIYYCDISILWLMLLL